MRIKGHKFLLQELLKNLLDNAIRFTPRGGRVTVRVAASGERATLVVEDSGPGIPPTERNRVFDRFYQIPGRSSTGCGLGLAIANEIVALHHAVISLTEPQANPGTQVTVAFALARPVLLAT